MESSDDVTDFDDTTDGVQVAVTPPSIVKHQEVVPDKVNFKTFNSVCLCFIALMWIASKTLPTRS